jgi:hypothetical protein
MKKIIIPFLFFGILTSCTSTYNIRKASSNLDERIVLNRDAKIMITVPEDAFYGQKSYQNSGKMTSYAIRDALQEYTRNLQVISQYQNILGISDEVISSYDYIFVPNIRKWIDYATEWSGRRDVLEVEILIYDCHSKKPIQSVIIYGRSRFVSFGGDHPQDLLNEPIETYIGSIF